MPTYHALGISAALTVADLQASCSTVTDLRMGLEQRQDAERIDRVFQDGRPLNQRPIGPDGGETGAVQFVGSSEDIPLLVVEAGNFDIGQLLTGPLFKGKAELALAAAGELGEPNGQGTEESPLISLGSNLSCSGRTPIHASTDPAMLRQPQTFTHHTPKSGRPKMQESGPMTPRPKVHEFGLSTQHKHAQALCLVVDLSNKAFLPSNPNNSRNSGKDLKLEVFLNGELVGSSFANARGSAVELRKDRVSFTGTRVHRQLERPWIYQPEVPENGDITADQRWGAVCSALSAEADHRGVNIWGGIPPSAELLQALSRLSLPSRLKDKSRLAIIDLVITAGGGKKFGPHKGYVAEPLRMVDPHYSDSGEAGSVGDGFVTHNAPSMSVGPYDEIYAPTAFLERLACSAPEISSAAQDFTNCMPETFTDTTIPRTPTHTPRKTRLQAYAAEVGLDGVHLAQEVSPYETSKGRRGSRRTVAQRLSDIRQMKGNNKEKALKDLQQQLGKDSLQVNRPAAENDAEMHSFAFQTVERNEQESVLNTLAQRSNSPKATIDPMDIIHEPVSSTGEPEIPEDDVGTQPSPFKKLKLSELSEFTMQTKAGFTSKTTINSVDIFHEQLPFTKAPLDPEDADSFLDFYQGQNFLALKADALTPGQELDHTAATSTRQMMKKITKASSLAGSPCSSPIKSQKKQRKAATPTLLPNMDVPYDLSPIPIDPLLARSSASRTKRTGRGANRTRFAWNPTDKTAEQAIKDFKIPALCEGSVVGYADASMKRQIGKARGGEFSEEVVVVGMRFVVV